MDSKFYLNIIDDKLNTQYGAKRSKEMQNASILLISARLITTIVILAMQIY